MKSLKTLIYAFSLAALLAVPAAHGAIITAVQDGNIDDSATWGGATIPTAGNTDTWVTDGFNITLNTLEFHGGLLEVTGGSHLWTPNQGNRLFQAMTFDNGGIRKWTNIATNFNFNQQTLTFESGGALFSSNNANRNIAISNAVWAGSGPITFERTAPAATENTSQSFLDISADNDLSGYTGIISLVRDSSSDGEGRLRFESGTTTTGSFGVSLGSGTRLVMPGADNSFIFSSLEIDGNAFDVGTYTWSDFDAEGLGGFFVGTAGEIQVIPEPRTYAAIFGLVVLGVVLIRRSRKNRVA